jgi:hypothetical protein
VNITSTSSLTLAAYRSPSLATWLFAHLLLHWHTYSGTWIAHFPKKPLIVARLVAYLPLYNSMLSETPGGRLALVFCVPPVLPAPPGTGSAHTQNSPFSELRFRFRAYTLHLVTLAYLPVQLAPSGHYTSERLTRPYSGKLLRFHGSFTVGNIARFPPGPVLTLACCTVWSPSLTL